ncbi:telomere-binding alpha subunit central domain protein [Aspergillus lucknowensis]|uniref:Protection of telomeres protein 1 n=1 Tax=Aspergillus lucknowensis TaxID=176173 RepID=A0ABR4LE69_9EURO
MMPAGLPPNYVDVANAIVTRGSVNVMGVVVDVWGGAFKSQGTSVCITFTIKDSNLNNGNTMDGLKIRYFKETETLLPPVREGDVVLLRDLRVKVIGSRPLGVAAQDMHIPWAIFRADRDPTSHLAALSGPFPFEPTYSEKAFASRLLDISPASFRAAPAPKSDFAQISASRSAPTTQKKFSLVKDIRDRQFVDLIGEILKIHGNDSEKATLYFTDYTSNENIFQYLSDNDDNVDHGCEGDPFNYIGRQRKKWNGPSGQMTIQITLWEPHASFVRGTFDVNDIVRLKNVRIKGSRVEGGSLEGVIHTNRDEPQRVNAFRVDLKNDPRVQQLLARKAEYWEAHPKQQKRKSDEDPEPRSKKANTKKQRVKAEPKKEEGQTSLSLNKKNVVSTYIKAGAPTNARSLSLDTILDNPLHNHTSPDRIEYRLPFQNLCYLSTVRVVDYYPPDLKDFAVLQEHVSLGYNKKRDPDASRTFTKWEWRFCLLVEDVAAPAPGQPKPRTKLFVSNADAEYLLRMGAVNLHENPTALGQLSEKLFILWGNLEECKKNIEADGKPLGLSSTPFNCCIKEYGITCSHRRGSSHLHDENGLPSCAEEECFGWERRFGLFKTTIHA